MGGVRSTYSVLVPVTTLDIILAGRFPGRPVLVKLDVEGNEYHVLQGGRDTLARHDVTWLVEHGLTENFDGKINPHFRDVFETFWGHGYEGWSLPPSRLVLRDDVDRWINLKMRDYGTINFLFKRPAQREVQSGSQANTAGE